MSDRVIHTRAGVVSLSSIVAVLAVLGALIPALGGGPSHWEPAQGDAVRERVVRDLIAADMEVPPASWSSVCVCVWSGSTALHGPGSCVDPSPELVHRLADLPPKVLPYSRCADDKRSIVVAVARIDWRAADFVRVGGAYICGPLCGEGFAYTLSRDRDGWSVDTAKPLWVS